MSLQTEIINELGVKPTIDPTEEIRKSIDFMKAYLKKYPFLKTFVLGISGGQDSTLAGRLAQLTMEEMREETKDESYQFIAVRLPYGEQADEEDAKAALDFIQPDVSLRVNIKPAVDAQVQVLSEAGVEISDFNKGNIKARQRMITQYAVADVSLRVNIKPAVDAQVQVLSEAGVEISDFNKGNIKARQRMITQYAVAGERAGAVLGTDHAAENITGFFTKFGDGGADILPLFRLNKRQGKQLLQALNAPEKLYTKIPTADLEDGKPMIADEVALGVTYDEIDDYLEGKEVPAQAQEKIEAWWNKTQHKRHLPISVLDDFWK